MAITLSGFDQFNLIWYRLIYPRANANELRAYIFRNGLPGRQRLYSKQQISAAEQRIKLTMKVGSTTASQFSLPQNVFRRHLFWSQGFPLGIVNTPIQDLCDYDECEICLQTCNRTQGKAYIGVRVREEGHYTHGEKWSLQLFIDSNNFVHSWLRPEPGTNKLDFRNFFNGVIARLPPNQPRTILMDNLRSHFDGVTWARVGATGHRFLPRCPYAPFDGPIEYVFNSLEGHLKNRLHVIHTNADLVREVNNIIGQLAQQGFRRYFVHCGY